jgi:YD repeat-containing protein
VTAEPCGVASLFDLDPDLGRTAYAYDALTRRTRDTLPGGRVTDYGYDAASNLTSLADVTGTVSYGYDEVNRLASLTEPGGAQSSFGYDGRGNRTTTSYPNGVVESRSHDGSDKLLTILARKGSAAPLTDFAYTYEDAAQRETTLRQTARDRDGETASYSYDALDRLTGAVTRGPGGSVVDQRSYAFDQATNRTRETVNGS